MSTIQLEGPYHRASNVSRAVNDRLYWMKMAAAVAAILVVWFVL